jgi:acetyl-CoA acyltransferase
LTLPSNRTLRDAVIVEAVRTPIGRGHQERGIYREIHPAHLLGRCFADVVERSGIDPEAVDTVIAGCAIQIAEQSSGITRTSWLEQGLPEHAGAITVDVRCGSGQEAVNFGALRIAAGVDEVVVAGGVEHMGRVGMNVNEAAQEQWGTAFTPELLERYDLVPQGVSAELIADKWNLTREAMDEFSLRSHQLAATATTEGKFDREIVGVPTPAGVQTADQGIRLETSLEKLASLKPAFREGGRVTAGNASQISDGGAALLLTSAGKARELGLRPRARIVDQVNIGVDPVLMLTGPIPATAAILERNGMTIGDIGVIEINEAFASVVLAWAQEHRADMARVNPRGGAIALGHPLGGSGARLLTTLLHELEDADEEFGLATMCCRGGLGTATLIQRL